MALRVTARRAQRLGTMAPNQTSNRPNNACSGEDAGTQGSAVAEGLSVGLVKFSLCNAKWDVRETVPPARAA